MDGLDLRTLMLSGVIGQFVCLAVMVSLWRRHRRRMPETGLWLAGYLLEAAAALLIAARGRVPDLVSVLPGTPLIVGGLWLLYVGLERHLGQRNSQRLNQAVLLGVVLAHAWFTLAQPSLRARSLIFSLGLLWICAQGAWLLLGRTGVAARRRASRSVGVVLVGCCLASLVRIVADLMMPPGEDLFSSGRSTAMVILAYQTLHLALTFALFLMVNHRLVGELEEDIAARKQAERSRRASEERFRNVFELSPLGKSITGLDGTLRVNRAFCEMLGYTAEEIGAKSWQDLTHPDDVEKSEEVTRSLCEGRIERVQFEKRYLHKSGRVVWAEVASVLERDQEQQPLNYLTTVQDITMRKGVEERVQAAQAETARLLQAAERSRKSLLSVVEDQERAERRLRESEERFRQVSLVSSDLVYSCVTDEGGDYRLDWLAGAAERITGYTNAELMARRCWGSLVVEEDQAQFRAQVTGLAVGADGTCELRLRRADGSVIWVGSNARCAADPGPAARPRLYGALVDITSRKRAEAKLKEQLDELRRWHDMMVGREMRMLDLKREVNALRARLGEPPRYESAREGKEKGDRSS